MMEEQSSHVKLADAELDDLFGCLDDSFLISRIKNVVVGDVHSDPNGEPVDDQPRLIVGTILRQLQGGSPSREAVGYLAHCLERHLGERAGSLDEAFYLTHKRPVGGQRISDEVELKTVDAYMEVIRRHTWELDPETGCEIFSVPSKAILRDAYQAAFEAYRDAVGKDYDEFNDPEKKINQTVKPILRRRGVLR